MKLYKIKPLKWIEDDWGSGIETVASGSTLYFYLRIRKEENLFTLYRDGYYFGEFSTIKNAKRAANRIIQGELKHFLEEYK